MDQPLLLERPVELSFHFEEQMRSPARTLVGEVMWLLSIGHGPA